MLADPPLAIKNRSSIPELNQQGYHEKKRTQKYQPRSGEDGIVHSFGRVVRGRGRAISGRALGRPKGFERRSTGRLSSNETISPIHARCSTTASKSTPERAGAAMISFKVKQICAMSSLV